MILLIVTVAIVIVATAQNGMIRQCLCSEMMECKQNSSIALCTVQCKSSFNNTIGDVDQLEQCLRDQRANIEILRQCIAKNINMTER